MPFDMEVGLASDDTVLDETQLPSPIANLLREWSEIIY